MTDFCDFIGSDSVNNSDLLVKLLQKFNSYVIKYYESGKPFMKGDFDFKYLEYLSKKNLNHMSLSVEEVFDDIAPLFQNIPIWANPGTMLNIIPHINIASLAVAAYASLLNPNFSQDRYAGLLLTAELEVVKYISMLVGWNWVESHGLFTFGGKGTNLYATKIALNRANPNGKKEGYDKNKYFIVTSKKGHPCHKEVANWMGIGSNNCVVASCDDNGEILVEETKEIICDNIERGKIFLGFNLTGGSTVEFEVDPIRRVSILRDEIVKKYHLDYSPLIHVDSVIAWVWLFFKQYDFISNPLNIDAVILEKVNYFTERISEIEYADSFGVDFHKSGFCPAISSLFIVRDRADIYNLGETDVLKLENLKFGNFSPFESSIELSRSSFGPLTALVSLKTFGVEGFQKAIVKLITTSLFFKFKLRQHEFIEIINNDSNGFATLFIIKPKKYESLNLQDILALPQEHTDVIKNYNLDFARYVNELNMQNKLTFTLTASDAFNVKNTNICLGSLKAYPMSLFATKEKIAFVVDEIVRTKMDFEQEKTLNLSDVNNSPVDMVYRK